jgi:integrase
MACPASGTNCTGVRLTAVSCPELGGTKDTMETQSKGSEPRTSLEEAVRELQAYTLEELLLDDALELYLADKRREYADATIKSHDYRLRPFIEWCRSNNIKNLNHLTGRNLHQYRIWLRDTRELSKPSEKALMDTLRVFIRWAESVEGVRPGLSEKVISPSLAKGEHARDAMLDHERASSILEYLRRYHYASADHVALMLFANTGVRTGTLRSFDVHDFKSGAEHPHMAAKHRPGETPLKNKYAGERCIFLSDSTCEVLQDYMADRRHPIQDEFGRDPLLTTKQGRMANSTIRKLAYQWTRPCALGQECPHGRTPSDCMAARRANHASKCPSSLSPHCVRRGYLTHELEQGVPIELLADRANVDEKTLSEYYDQRSEEQRMIQRKKIFEEAHLGGPTYGGT